MSDLFIRPESHEIDTKARRLVPSAFPTDWEHRELTGRDYGIDMIMEKFHQGAPTGNYLSLQIKGTKKLIGEDITTISYDLSISTLRYVEMFISPVLLTICPINDENKRVFYLWLQKYIDVILNFDNPTWRSNKETVRVHIPIKNVINNKINVITWISNHPKRMKEFLQMSIISTELDQEIDNFFCVYQQFLDGETEDNEVNKILNKIINYTDEIQKLQSIFGDKGWISPQTYLKETIIPFNRLAKKLLENKEKMERLKVAKLNDLKYTASFIKMLNDLEHERFLWEYYKDHDF